MKEYNFLKIIKDQTQSTYIGNDCAYLKELGIVVTQDNFIEDIHFKRNWATPYQIGYKATAVNISDILASGAEPAYIPAFRCGECGRDRADRQHRSSRHWGSRQSHRRRHSGEHRRHHP